MDVDFDITVEFGVLDDIDPEKSYLLQDERRGGDAFERAKREYRCISIPDDVFQEMYPFISDIPTFFGSLKKPFAGLDPYGVTLIPPQSCQDIADILERSIDAFSHIESAEAVIALLDYAAAQEKYAIFYGV